MACATVLRAVLHDRHRTNANASGVGSALAPNQTDESTSDPCHDTWDTKTRHCQPDHVFPTLLVHPMPHQLEVFKSAEHTHAGTSRLFLAMTISMIINLLVSFWIFPVVLYEY